MEDILLRNANDSYHSGNYEKYQTKNPIKKKCINRFNQRLLKIIRLKCMNPDQQSSKFSPIRIMDAGCGEGFITRRVANEFKGAELIGVDGNREAIDVAKMLDPGIDFREGDIYTLDFPENYFDLVLCSEVLEHLLFPVKALRELKRVVREGGTILLSVPNEPWFCLGNLLAMRNVLRLGNPIDHVNHWTYHGFKRFLLQEFSNDEIDFYKSFPWSIAAVTCKK